MITLNQSQVIFKEYPHGYFLGDMQLSGITGLIHAATGLGVYEDASDYVRNFLIPKAGEKGTCVHKAIEHYDLTGEMMTLFTDLKYNDEIDVSDQLGNYIRLREGYIPVANEYTVSDNLMYASNIDNVWGKEGDDVNVWLVDTKTNNLDLYPGGEQALIEYLSWQLSCYAYMFEKQNPHLKVAGLLGNWFRDNDCRQWVIERKDDETIKKLLEVLYDRDENGHFVYEHHNEFKPEQHAMAHVPESSLIAPHIIREITALLEEEKKAKEQLEALKASLKQAMIDNGIKSWDAGSFSATIAADSVAKTFDTTRFKKEQPEIYQQYIKETQKAGAFTLKLK